MSVFDNVPDPFPFDASVAKRPATFVLRSDRADRYIVGFIALFWLVIGVPVAIAVALLACAAAGLQAYAVPASIAAVAALIAVWRWWWWREFAGSFRVVNVTISDDSVDVQERGLIQNRAWSHPLSGFEGVALVHLGTRLIGASKAPLAGVVLKHPDPARSVPLVIARSNNVGRQTVQQKAAQLRVPALTGIAEAKGAGTYPPDAIVINRRQALKLRLVQAGFAGATLIFAAVAIRQFGSADADPIWPVIAVILVPVLIAMHMFARQYVIEMRDSGGEIALRTGAILFPWRRFPQQSIRALDHHEGRMSTIRQSVHTPYVKMRVEGYTFPFVIDMQSDFVDEGRLRGLSMWARPAAPAKKGRRRR